MKLLDLALKEMFISNHSKITMNKCSSLYGNVVLCKVNKRKHTHPDYLYQ